LLRSRSSSNNSRSVFFTFAINNIDYFTHPIEHLNSGSVISTNTPAFSSIGTIGLSHKTTNALGNSSFNSTEIRCTTPSPQRPHNDRVLIRKQLLPSLFEYMA
jgi:hypothetical protein